MAPMTEEIWKVISQKKHGLQSFALLLKQMLAHFSDLLTLGTHFLRV